MQVVLDTLAPAERAAFVLHDVFGYPFDDIGAVMGRSVTAVRQLASRARRKVQGTPEPAASKAARAEGRRVVEAFLAAARGGDLTTLLSLLAPDAVIRADLVGQQMGTDPVYDGAAAVAARFDGARGAAPVTIDGELGAAWIQAGSTRVAFVFHAEAGLVREVELIADPEVLATLDVVPSGANPPGPDADPPTDRPTLRTEGNTMKTMTCRARGPVRCPPSGSDRRRGDQGPGPPPQGEGRGGRQHAR